MRTTLRALAALLGYPDAALRGDLPEIRDALRDAKALSLDSLDALEALVARLAAADALEAEAQYVALFDCARATSLNLFEHVHGDSRERGPAMIDLAKTYGEAGLDLAPGQLPDYLPVALEFASTQPPLVARAFLGEIAHVVNAIHGALRARASDYAAITAALLELAGEKARPVASASELPIDEAWEEPAAFGECARARPGAPQPIQFIRKKASGGAVA
jgi:nitrate reductase molybdenum cofactor assembly chaperone NarJ/NarW